MIAVIVFGLGIPFYAVDPRYVLNPVSATYNHETQKITLVRETQAARDYPWLTTFAEYHVEAALLANPHKTCPGPLGETEYEIIDGPPPNTTEIPAGWLAECTNGADTIYRVAYRPALQVNRGIFDGLRISIPRRIVFETLIRPQSEAIERRLDLIEEKLDASR